MIVAEIRAVPVGAEASMEKTVDAVKAALEDCDIQFEVGPVSTTFEVDALEDLFETVQCCHEAALETAPRVILNLTIDQTADQGVTVGAVQKAGSRRSNDPRRSTIRDDVEGEDEDVPTFTPRTGNKTQGQGPRRQPATRTTSR